MRTTSKLALPLLGLLALVFTADLAEARRTVVVRHGPAVTRVAVVKAKPVVTIPMPAVPAVRVLVADPAPRKGWVWVRGHWTWRAGTQRWVWVDAHWMKR